MESGDVVVGEIWICVRNIFHHLIKGGDCVVDFGKKAGQIAVDVLMIIEASKINEKDLPGITEAFAACNELSDRAHFVTEIGVGIEGIEGVYEIESKVVDFLNCFGNNSFGFASTGDDRGV